MSSFSGQKWKMEPDLAEHIKGLLLKEGGIEHDTRGSHETWRVKFSDATFTYYDTGTLFCTASRDGSVIQFWQEISRHATGFVKASRDFLIGLDETGKGEVLGHTVLAGVVIQSNLFDQFSRIVGVADTKKRHSFSYWDNILKNLDSFSPPEFQFTTETVPPWHIDKFNINNILDVVYQRILSNFTRTTSVNSCRIVLDDYGTGSSLRRFLQALGNAGAEVIVEPKADDNYLEAKVASLIAKREREKMMEVISKSEEWKINGAEVGTGNGGDPQTLAWLRAWKSKARPWPWFVKTSFRTVRDPDGLPETAKIRPPIREDLLSEDFKKKFEEGRFSVTSLSIVCPFCGERAKALLITLTGNMTEARCVGCRKPIPGLSLTLRYYCGFILPDSNIIIQGLLSKDLDHARFFEGFTILFDPIVKVECQTPGGRKELEKLARFGAMGRVKLQDVEPGPGSKPQTSAARDEQIKEDALRYNAILLSGDNAMKAFAQSKGMFCLCV